MLVQEPLQAAIWHCLNHYAYSDATFLAELLLDEVNSDDSLHLLATCYYRSGRLNEAYDILNKKGIKTPQNRFLMAKCCADLERLAEAESVLTGDSFGHRKDPTADEMLSELGDAAAFGFQLLGSIYGRTERIDRAKECEKKALKLNPFLWKAFESLCGRGEFLDPNRVFTTGNLDNLTTCHGVNNILQLVNNAQIPVSSSNPPPANPNPHITVTSTPNNWSTPANPNPNPAPTPTPNNPAMVTPINEESMDTTNNESIPLSSFNSTPMNNSRNTPSCPLSGIGALNFSSTSSVMENSHIGSEVAHKNRNMLMPPPFKSRVRMRNQLNKTPSLESNVSTVTPVSLAMRNVEDGLSGTPTFGMLPRHFKGEVGGSIAVKLDFSSPSLSVLSPCTAGSAGQGNDGLEKPTLSASKPKRTIMAIKENPLKPSVFSQSGNNSNNSGNQNITPANQVPRRSSRLFGSNQAVKENSKAPSKKTRAIKSPSRKNKGTRNALSNAQQQEPQQQQQQQVDQQLAEKNEKNKDKPLSIEKEDQDENKKLQLSPPVITNVNLGAHALVIQKQSVEGLMCLLRQLGSGYAELSKYNCRKAVKILDAVPPNHRSAGWILGLLGRAHFEMAEYKEAKVYFKELRDLYPYRLENLEFFSTALWHLQDDVQLSSLAQDLTRIDKLSPQAWCAAGNCFSRLKEHENAIKFFQRAVQVNPHFAYAYTLLGHEYIMIDEMEKALACFRSATRINPRHYNAWYGIGLTYFRQERYPLADIYYKKALSINSVHPVLMCHVAVVQHAMQKTDKALEMLSKAITLSPKNSLCKFERASILFAAERYTDALQELNELKELVPKESPVYFLLGKVHTKLNNTPLALMHFSWAMDLDPKGANSQIKDALDPTLNRAQQEDAAAVITGTDNTVAQVQQDETMQTDNDFQDISEPFNPDGGASTSQESLEASTGFVQGNLPNSNDEELEEEEAAPEPPSLSPEMQERTSDDSM